MVDFRCQNLTFSILNQTRVNFSQWWCDVGPILHHHWVNISCLIFKHFRLWIGYVEKRVENVHFDIIVFGFNCYQVIVLFCLNYFSLQDHYLSEIIHEFKCHTILYNSIPWLWKGVSRYTLSYPSIHPFVSSGGYISLYPKRTYVLVLILQNKNSIKVHSGISWYIIMIINCLYCSVIRLLTTIKLRGFPQSSCQSICQPTKPLSLCQR